MKPPVLTKRLEKIYDFIENGDCIVDVGCDHGLLPVYSMLNGKCPRAFATDISRPSLQKTIDLAKVYGVDVGNACCDGLKDVPDELYDTVVIAGMGGLMIADILQNSPLHSIKKYILQPMTAQYELRQYLNQSGFAIVREALVKEDGRIYNVIVAIPNAEQALSETELHLGVCVKNEPLFEEYLEHKINQLKMILENLQHSRNESEKKQEITALLDLFQNVSEKQ